MPRLGRGRVRGGQYLKCFTAADAHDRPLVQRRDALPTLAIVGQTAAAEAEPGGRRSRPNPKECWTATKEPKVTGAPNAPVTNTVLLAGKAAAVVGDRGRGPARFRLMYYRRYRAEFRRKLADAGCSGAWSEKKLGCCTWSANENGTGRRVSRC